ncbi:MAG TPA: DoxX family membrane protein [Solirubrobacteraceae bacterium]|nr:DoxX family membrane protein [Solirubrobacteraceae bacterium]
MQALIDDSEAPVTPELGRRRRGRLTLGIVFIGAGVNHFLMPRPYERIVPPSMKSRARELVAISGVAEIAGGLGVLLPWTRRPAGLGLIALLAAVFPANLHMALSPGEFRRIPRWALYARLPLQPLMMWWAWSATRDRSGEGG